MEFEFYERSSVSVRIAKKENFSMKRETDIRPIL